MTRGNPKKQKENYAELVTSPSELLTLVHTAVGQYATHISKYPKITHQHGFPLQKLSLSIQLIYVCELSRE